MECMLQFVFWLVSCLQWYCLFMGVERLQLLFLMMKIIGSCYIVVVLSVLWKLFLLVFFLLVKVSEIWFFCFSLCVNVMLEVSVNCGFRWLIILIIWCLGVLKWKLWLCFCVQLLVLFCYCVKRCFSGRWWVVKIFRLWCMVKINLLLSRVLVVFMLIVFWLMLENYLLIWFCWSRINIFFLIMWGCSRFL